MTKLEKSTHKGKKWMVKTPSGKTVHFGSSDYEDFTQHHDQKRRESYCARAMAIRDKQGHLTAYDKESANYYATHLLWKCDKLPAFKK